MKPPGTTRLNSPDLLCILHVAVVRSSSGRVMMRCVLPVLWMTSCFLYSVIRRHDAVVAASLYSVYRLILLLHDIGCVQWWFYVGARRDTGPPNLAQAPKFFQGNLGT